MANRRMFSLDIVDTDKFLDMPISAQCLYFHLGMRADDDGFISSPKQIMRMTTCTQGDMRILIENGFIIPFESGIVVIRHWKQHNYIQSDRYRKTKFTEERSRLELTNNVYMLDTENIQTVSSTEAQYRLSKDIVRDRDSIGKYNKTINSFISPEREEKIENLSDILMILNDKSTYNVPLDKIQTWEKAFPAVDIKQELYKMSAWLESNPTRRKTKRGIERFINTWLSKEQDRGGTYRNGNRQQPTEVNEPYSQQAIYDEMYKGLVRLEGEEDVFA